MRVQRGLDAPQPIRGCKPSPQSYDMLLRRTSVLRDFAAQTAAVQAMLAVFSLRRAQDTLVYQRRVSRSDLLRDFASSARRRDMTRPCAQCCSVAGHCTRAPQSSNHIGCVVFPMRTPPYLRVRDVQVSELARQCEVPNVHNAFHPLYMLQVRMPKINTALHSGEFLLLIT